MRSPLSYDRLVTPLDMPIAVRRDQARIVPLSVERRDAQRTAHAAITGAFFRPADIALAEIAWPMLAWVPYWCVHVDVAGVHIGIHHTGKRGWLGGFVPIPGLRHKDAVVPVVARSFMPFVPDVRPATGAKARPSEAIPPIFHHTVRVRGFAIPKEAMVPADQYTPPRGEIVQPDVTIDKAEDEAKAWLRAAVQPADAIYARYTPVVRSSVLCHYPMYVTRYRYDGAARGDAGEVFYVTVSGHDGKILASRHPSWWRAVRTWLP